MDIDELLTALVDYQTANVELRECHDRCEYDAGYYCSEYQYARDRRRETLTDALNQYIDSRIRHVLMSRE